MGVVWRGRVTTGGLGRRSRDVQYDLTSCTVASSTATAPWTSPTPAVAVVAVFQHADALFLVPGVG